MFFDAFAYCKNLEKIYFEEGSHLFYIYSGSIYSLNKLKYFRLPKTVTTIPTNLSLGGNPNWETLIYCGTTLFPRGTFMRADDMNIPYCPKTIYVRNDYPANNFAGCQNLKRLRQCSLMPPSPCKTVMNNYDFEAKLMILSCIFLSNDFP